jgi:hypothetical protein
MDKRKQRLVDLQNEMKVLRILIGSTKKDSPQQSDLIDSYWPMLANVHALAEELSYERVENRSYQRSSPFFPLFSSPRGLPWPRSS